MRKTYTMRPELRAKWVEARTVHGAYANGKEAAVHYIWRSMLARCYRVTDKSYKYYGARGIRVCEEWHAFANFKRDMGAPVSADFSLDRIDVAGNYELSNCRWATRSQQQKNKVATRRYIREGDNFVGTLVECAALCGISKELAHWRWKSWLTFRRGEQWHELQNHL